jgi:ABC-type Co2+ transport system permease subunit
MADSPDFAKYVSTRCSAEHNASEMKRPTPLVFFSICAAVDFALGCFKVHSIGSGVLAIVFGLPLTALLFFYFMASWKGNDDSGAPGG